MSVLIVLTELTLQTAVVRVLTVWQTVWMELTVLIPFSVDRDNEANGDILNTPLIPATAVSIWADFVLRWISDCELGEGWRQSLWTSGEQGWPPDMCWKPQTALSTSALARTQQRSAVWHGRRSTWPQRRQKLSRPARGTSLCASSGQLLRRSSSSGGMHVAEDKDSSLPSGVSAKSADADWRGGLGLRQPSGP